MSKTDVLTKRVFDFCVALLGLLFLWPIILVAWVVASVETRSNGIFKQVRIGQFGRPFHVLKIKTMYDTSSSVSAITALNVGRITKTGAFFRRYKIDELPQLLNVLVGEMSFVGPRPDVAGYADKLEGNDARILNLRPGITGPASLKYRNEEEILSSVPNPSEYNDTVIWPDKVHINKVYMAERSLLMDLKIIYATLFR